MKIMYGSQPKKLTCKKSKSKLDFHTPFDAKKKNFPFFCQLHFWLWQIKDGFKLYCYIFVGKIIWYKYICLFEYFLLGIFVRIFTSLLSKNSHWKHTRILIVERRECQILLEPCYLCHLSCKGKTQLTQSTGENARYGALCGSNWRFATIPPLTLSFQSQKLLQGEDSIWKS